MTNGVVYIAVGNIKYIKECIFSAKSLKQFCPDLSITLFTDNTSIRSSCFDSIKFINDEINPMKIKVKYLCESPYQKTLFLDSDTQVKAPLYEMFNELDEFDIGLASYPKIDRNYIPAKLVSYEQENLYNTGVVLFKDSIPTTKFFQKWLDAVMLQNSSDMWAGHYCDQHYFNELIANGTHYECGVNLKLLPNKLYNVRPPMISPLIKTGEIKQAKIIHCHNLHRSFLARQGIRILDRISRERKKKLSFKED